MLVAAGALALLVAAGRHQHAAIEADRTAASVEVATVVPVVAPTPPEAPPEAQPGATALPHPVEPRRRRLPPTEKTPLDTVEPWTGEDLGPQVEVLAMQRPHLEVDRADPWNPGTYYPAGPSQNPGLEDNDPWAHGAETPRARIAARSKNEERRGQKIEREDPWAGPLHF
jgi:hypothetical protein